MLSAVVDWRDIDVRQWANLWHLLHDPNRQPARIVALLDHDVPVAVIHDRDGPYDLSVWPTSAPSVEAAARTLLATCRVGQVIVIERDALDELWDAQTRAYSREDDYDTYLARCQDILADMLQRRAVIVPSGPGPLVDAAQTIPYGDLRALLGETPPTFGSFLFTVFNGRDLWWSVAGRLDAGKIAVLTSSHGLNGVAHVEVPYRGSPLEQHERLVEACAKDLGPVSLSRTMQLEEFVELLNN